MKQIKNQAKGFTIIEVVLVLAIAGLIFLMVFIAIPALQRNQRDTQRREDVSRFVSQLEQYRTNNRGKLPAASQTAMNGFLNGYMNTGAEGFKDPEGEDYTIVFTAPTSESQIQYSGPEGQCNGESVGTGGNSRTAAVAIKLEGSGFYCQTNQ